jgi:hypothetical protein
MMNRKDSKTVTANEELESLRETEEFIDEFDADINLAAIEADLELVEDQLELETMD